MILMIRSLPHENHTKQHETYVLGRILLTIMIFIGLWPRFDTSVQIEIRCHSIICNPM